MKYLSHILGCMPKAETGTSLSDPDRLRRQLLEANVYRRMLFRRFPLPEDRTLFFIVILRQEGGEAFYNVALSYDHDDPCSEAFARQVERDLPEYWDQQARQELTWFSESLGYYRALVRGEIQEDDIPEYFRGTAPPQLAVRNYPAGATTLH